MKEPAPLVLRTAAPGETRALAAALAAHCHPGDVLLLCGGLGAGKTTFAQGFGAAIGVTEPITSPTFTLVRQYPVAGAPTPEGRVGVATIRTLLHVDVWRLDRLHEAVDLGLGEMLEDGAVALVEWGDAVAPLLGVGALEVELDADLDGDHSAGTGSGSGSGSHTGPNGPSDSDTADGGDTGHDRRRITLRPSGQPWAERWEAVVGSLGRWRAGA